MKNLKNIVDLLDDDFNVWLSICVSPVENKDLHFFIGEKNKKMSVVYSYMATGDKITDIKCEKILFGRGFCNLMVHINNMLNFDFSKGTPFSRENQYAYIFYPNSRQITLPKKCDNIDFIEFYTAINYLLSYARLDKKYLLEYPSDYKKDIVEEAIELDNEIISFMRKYESGRKNSLEKKLNEEWKKTDFDERCDELCSKMNNFELLNTIFETEYVYEIGACLKKFKPFEFNSNNNKENLSFITSWGLLICESDLSEYFIKTIIEKTEVFKYIDEFKNS